MTAATFGGWGVALAFTHGVDRWRRRLRRARLGSLGGERPAEDRARLPSGVEVRLELRPDHGCRLRVRVPVPGLPDGLRVGWEPAARHHPVSGLLHLALAREGLLGRGFELRARAETLEMVRAGLNLPSERQIREVVARVERAVGVCRALEDPEAARGAALRGLLDRDPRVRLSAALMTGGLGRTVLARLASDRQQPLDLRVEALEALSLGPPNAESAKVLERCATGPERLGRFAVRALAEREGGPARIAHLVGADRLDPEVARLAVERIVRRARAPEPLLLDALPGACAPAQRAILDHIADTGGAVAHAALDRLLSNGGLGIRLDGALRRAARATRARLIEERGALSEPGFRASGERGALALASAHHDAD
jgi:hypothetical protein